MPDRKALSVTELTELVKQVVEASFDSVLVDGEISNWRPAPSGHVYFTLKDRGAMIQAVMFKGKAVRLAFRPADGMAVRASGSLGVYAARGQYQIIVDSLEKAGEGELLAMLEERKRRLAAEGLFDPVRKRPIPAFPSRVAVITSPTGAAIRDILNVMKRRNAGIRITILPSLVQGDEAPASIARQIQTANAFGLGDVIIVGRGGGSMEDLAAFSDEAVVRAVAVSSIPVISAVGHEIDWSLCDLAADLRAPTPSAAAELVSEHAEDVIARVATAAGRLEDGMRSRLDRAFMAIRYFSAEALEMRLERIQQPLRQRFDDAKESLVYGISTACSEARHRLSSAESVLRASDPAAVLARGFAVVRKQGSTLAVRAASELQTDEHVCISYAIGQTDAVIKEIRT
jgi:exodeoxyribonuclease VII large subunit